MGNRLYVGNMPFTINDEELKKTFEVCGQVVSAKVIMDKFSGRSKGFGFVEMSSETEAQAAIQKFNGTDLGGRKVVVSEAKPMEERKDRPGGGGRGGFGGGGRDRY